MKNVKIKEVAFYHPTQVIDSDYLIQHFDNQGKDVRGLLKNMGRKIRYKMDENENGISMAIEASKKVLNQAGLNGDDIDMIVYSTQIPDQTIPVNALYIHKAIDGKNRVLAYDLNANCAGMTVAVEQVSRTMLINPRIKRALVVGSDPFSFIQNPEDELSYCCFGDLSVAIILEKTEESTGFIDAIHYIDSTEPDVMKFPESGLSNLLENKSDRFMKWTPFSNSDMAPLVYESIREILNEHKLSPSDVKCCFSQSNQTFLESIQNELGFKENHMIYVGDKFGYPGTSSPFLALHEGIKSGKIKRGDYVLFWTVGTGYEFITMLFKY